MHDRAPGSTPRVVIVGSGFAGLCLAINLQKQGIQTFTILEKADRLGGTWRDNVYPGAACDVPSLLYCFSFEPKTDWSKRWAPQAEILEYMEHCADKYRVRSHIRFGTALESAAFDEGAGVWRIRTSTGESLEAEILVSGVGQLNRPSFPRIEGRESFGGPSFHSAEWDHSVDLAGKKVAVVGNAASAVQFVPEIAKMTRELVVFQRSANWMLPKNDHAYTPEETRRLRRHPRLAKFSRQLTWVTLEARFPVLKQNRFMAQTATDMATKFLEEEIDDPELRGALTPDYPIGAKRILISDDYYATLRRDDVRLVTDPIERVTETGIETRDGTRHDVDVIIYATGFDSTSFLVPMVIQGRGGLKLHDAWKGGAEAYLGLSVSGFPNFFMMYGPNTNLGHNSIIFMLECQTRYILECIEKMQRWSIRWIDVRPDVQADYNEWIQRELGETVWAQINASWYKNTSGRITNNWSRRTAGYWMRTRHADLRLYETRAVEGGGGA